jgi:hypothetical protein
MVAVRFQLTRSEFLRMFRQVLVRRRTGWLAFAVGPALAALGVVASSTSSVVFGCLYTAFWTGLYYVFYPHRAWRTYPQIREPQAVTVSREGIAVDLFKANAQTDWAYWSDITKYRDAYVLRYERAYTFIPLRAFDTPAIEAEFEALVAAHMPAKR